MLPPSIADAFGERLYIRQHRVDEVRLADIGGKPVDQRRADHRRVGDTGNLGGLRRSLMPKPTAIGSAVCFLSRATALATPSVAAERVPVMPAMAT